MSFEPSGVSRKEFDRLIAQCVNLARLRLADELVHNNVMGRIAIALFDEQNNRTDEECVTKVAEVVRERDRLRQHLHDEHQRHIGTMDERDALAALLKEASDDWVPHASSLSAAIVGALRAAGLTEP
jgi:hypothetical protein